VTYAERAYFNREPCQHCASREDHLAIVRIEQRWKDAAREIRSDRRIAA